MEHSITGTDNRDRHCTVLNLSDGNTVQVDPIKLFINMTDNLPDEHIQEDSFRSVLEQFQTLFNYLLEQ